MSPLTTTARFSLVFLIAQVSLLWAALASCCSPLQQSSSLFPAPNRLPGFLAESSPQTSASASDDWQHHQVATGPVISVLPLLPLFSFYFFKVLFTYILERGREGQREGEKHWHVVASCAPLIGDLAHNPDMRPDWESNQWPFDSQAGAQSTEPRHPGPLPPFYWWHLKICIIKY